jgi:hypothetical protein
VTLPAGNVVLRKSLATTAYALMVDPNPATGETALVSLALAQLRQLEGCFSGFSRS